MKYLLLACLLLTGCGSESHATYPVPTPKLASLPAGATPATTCFESEAQWDPESGCLGWKGGVSLVVTHDNQMTESFRWIGAAYSIDGVLVLDTNDPSILDRQKLVVATTDLEPGYHEIVVDLHVRGHGKGIFSYLSGYKFRVRSFHAFEIEPGKPMKIKVVAHELGATTPIEKRPQIRFVETPPP